MSLLVSGSDPQPLIFTQERYLNKKLSHCLAAQVMAQSAREQPSPCLVPFVSGALRRVSRRRSEASSHYLAQLRSREDGRGGGGRLKGDGHNRVRSDSCLTCACTCRDLKHVERLRQCAMVYTV